MDPLGNIFKKASLAISSEFQSLIKDILLMKIYY